GDGVAAAIGADILAHHEHALVAKERVGYGLPAAVAIGAFDELAGRFRHRRLRAGLGDDVEREILDRLPRRLLAGRDGVADLRLDLGLDGVDLLLVHEAVVEQPALEPRDGRALAPFGHLGLVAVFLGVEHRVGPRAVGAAFEELRATAGPDRP